MRRTIGCLSHDIFKYRSKIHTTTDNDNSVNLGRNRLALRNLYEQIRDFAMRTNVERKRVIIIGAGASGIAAATRLYENGITDIAVLEAENRIGGRVSTIDIKNGILEMGAQWIHGQKDNVVYELASNRNLTCDSSAFDSVICARSNGDIIEEELTRRLKEIFYKMYEQYSESDFQSFKNLGEFYTHIIETEFKDNENADIPDYMKSEFLEFCHQFMNSLEASDTWFETSVSTLSQYKTCEGNSTTMWNGVGFRTLFNILMEKSREISGGNFELDVIALNTEVEKICWKNDISSMIVECSNGRIFHADHVIVTVSVGVLRELYSELFENIQIPELKIRSINNVEFGTVDKIYLEFSEPWWPEECNGFDLLWTKSDREEYVEKGLEWITDMFAVITVEFAPNVLCGWICGAAARTMESLDEQFVLDIVTQVLRKFLSKRWEIPIPTRLIRSTWHSNKHFRGSYSSRSLRTDEAGVSASTLSIPVNDGKGIPMLLFAGEATSPHYFSTVHGAVESGWREADRLIPFIKKM